MQYLSIHRQSLKSIRTDRTREDSILASQESKIEQLMLERFDTIKRSINLEIQFKVSVDYLNSEEAAKYDIKESQLKFERKRKELLDDAKAKMNEFKLQEKNKRRAVSTSSSSKPTKEVVDCEDDGEGEEDEDDRNFIVDDVEDDDDEEADEEMNNA